MSHEEWMTGGLMAFAFGLFVAGKMLIRRGDFEMTSWDWRLEAPEGEQGEEEAPQAHIESEHWIATHPLEWWEVLEEERGALDFSLDAFRDAPLPEDEGLEDVRTFRIRPKRSA